MAKKESHFVSSLWRLLGTNQVCALYLPVWPIHASNTPDYLVSDRNRLSSTFGPRQKASAGDRYDWHRGIDIPADCNTPPDTQAPKAPKNLRVQ